MNNNEHYTLIMTQNKNQKEKFSFHLNDKKRNVKYYIMTVHFSEFMMLDAKLMDQIVSVLAHTFAKHIFHKKINRSPQKSLLEVEKEAKLIVQKALKKIRHNI